MTPSHEYSVAIEDKHLDLFGHVNNAAYLQLFEQARWDWITKNGFGVDEVKRLGVGPTILEIRLRFKREVTAGDRVRIDSRALEYRGKLGRLEQTMTRADGQVACVVELVFGLFDLKARKLLRPTPEWLRAVGLE